MKIQSKRFLLSAAMVSMIVFGQTAYAAQDPLMLPEKEGLQVISAMEGQITVESPSTRTSART